MEPRVRPSRQSVRYTVQSASSEHPDYPYSELNQQTEETLGWRSAPHCEYPQTIQLRFSQRVDLAQLQLLSHEYMIPSKVELLTMDPDSGIHHWVKLGHFSLGSNDVTEHRGRELKTVQLSGPASLMTLRLMEPHPTPLNQEAQVSVVAVSVFGQPTAGLPVLVRSPGLDLLAQDLNVDVETAFRIRNLTATKAAAVENEDYSLAKQCKLEIRQILDLSARKNHAAAREDFNQAKEIHMQIRQLLQSHGHPRGVPTLRLPPIR
eukprot:TRINITY_DN3563_c0_g1_i1.p1 TRINITY_DN3563_c0_g1~~TRINITY_DN3563_c0_g1_i1.p1  ORF type:complete len:263 (+),score=56.71 TRINITY_DN3563_c0_g1_i1:173-961(+)